MAWRHVTFADSLLSDGMVKDSGKIHRGPPANSETSGGAAPPTADFIEEWADNKLGVASDAESVESGTSGSAGGEAKRRACFIYLN